MVFLTPNVHFILLIELKNGMKAHGFETKHQTIYQMIADLEADGVGKLHFDEFFLMITARVG